MERTKKVVRLLVWSFLCFVIILLAEGTPLQAANTIKIPPDVQRILDNGPRTSAEIALYQAASLRFRQPLKNGKPKASKCGFSVAADLYSFRNSFTPEEKNFITLALQPRQELQTSIVSPSGIFRIHYDTVGDNAPDMTDNNHNGIPDYIDAVAQICDSSYNFEVTSLGYLPPPRDGNRGDDDLYDLYVSDLYSLSGTYYGYTWPDFDNQTNTDTTRPSFSSSFYIDNSFSADKGFPTTGLDAARVTIAHEFFHVIQIGDYGIYQTTLADACDSSSGFLQEGSKVLRVPKYLFEMSSVWMETVVYPGIPDYLEYVSWLFANITNDLQFGITPCTDLGYSLGLVFHYADGQYRNDHSIIHQIWDQSLSAPPLQAMDKAFRARGSSLADFWCGFCTSLLFTDSRANDTLTYYSYNDARKYPPVQFQAVEPYVPQSFTDSIHVLTSAYYAFSLNSSSHDTLYAVITNTDTVAGFNKDLSYKNFTLNIGQNYQNPIPGTDLTYQFLPNLNNWCVTLTKASIDESGLVPPYPDPFIIDGTAQISFPIKSSSIPKKVELKVFTESGRLAYNNSSIVPVVQSGRLVAQWNGEQNSGGSVQTGVYIYMLNVNSTLSEGKIAIIRK